MSARLEIGDEGYTITHGLLSPDQPNDPVQKARATYLSTTAHVWVDEARRAGRLSYYDPDHDCTLATIIARHLNGRAICQPPPPVKSGTTF